ncbi:hypothetical protein D3C84_538970 [compost metagenome]
MQDVGGLAHLHHEGGAAAGQVVAGAYAGEDAVHQRQFAACRRHEAADVGEQDYQCGLAHVGRLTAHVRAGDDQHAGGVVQGQVVGHEGRVQHLLHHRMAALVDAHAGLVDEARTVQVEVQCTLGEVAQHVQLGKGGCGVLQRRQLLDQQLQQLVVEQFFPRQGAALGRQRLVFEGFQLRGDEALGTL